MRNWRFIPLTAAIHLAVVLTIPDAGIHSRGLDPAVNSRLILDGFGLLGSMILGYIFFIVFISGQGMRHVRLSTEIDLARDIHAVLVPPIEFCNQRFDIYGTSLPTSEVGGDLLDLDVANGTLTCYVADISGHGVGANLLMGMFKSAVRTRLRQEGDLATLITDVNNALYPLRKPSMFLTTAAIRFTEGAPMEFLVAGHLPILHYRAAERTAVSLTTRQLGVGIQANYEFKKDSAEVQAGDCLLLATDGITEVEDRHGSAFGLERLAALLQEEHARPAKEIYELIRSHVARQGAQKDDQTLLVIRCLEPENGEFDPSR